MTGEVFDGLYSGTIPYYWGATGVDRDVPRGVAVPPDAFTDGKGAWEHARAVEPSENRAYREAGYTFIPGMASAPFKRPLLEIVG